MATMDSMRGDRCAEEEGRVAGTNTPITYILPDEGWAPLLEIIVRECPAASVIEVNTAGCRPWPSACCGRWTGRT